MTYRKLAPVPHGTQPALAALRGDAAGATLQRRLLRGCARARRGRRLA